jgi:hypothetical protein
MAVEERDLAAEVIGRAEDLDVRVQVLEIMLGVRTGHRHRLCDLVSTTNVSVVATR